jgi:hypothetical protein
MSGGHWEYFQTRYEWSIAIEDLKKHIEFNEDGYEEKTIEEFKKGLDYIMKAQIYLQRLDWLFSGDDGEDSFHRRLKEELYER